MGGVPLPVRVCGSLVVIMRWMRGFGYGIVAVAFFFVSLPI